MADLKLTVDTSDVIKGVQSSANYKKKVVRK